MKTLVFGVIAGAVLVQVGLARVRDAWNHVSNKVAAVSNGVEGDPRIEGLSLFKLAESHNMTTYKCDGRVYLGQQGLAVGDHVIVSSPFSGKPYLAQIQRADRRPRIDLRNPGKVDFIVGVMNRQYDDISVAQAELDEIRNALTDAYFNQAAERLMSELGISEQSYLEIRLASAQRRKEGNSPVPVKRTCRSSLTQQEVSVIESLNYLKSVTVYLDEEDLGTKVTSSEEVMQLLAKYPDAEVWSHGEQILPL